MSLSSHPFFSQLGEEAVGPLKERAELHEFREGDVIFNEGDMPEALFLVLEGQVGFYKNTHSDEHYPISQSGPGEYFGEIGVLTGTRRSLQAKAMRRLVLARIPADVVIEYVGSVPGPVLKLFRGVIDHLEHTTNHYLDDMLRKEKMAVVGNMINSIIHDFKNPFCLISMGAQLIRQKHSDEATERLCQNIEEQVQRMVTMASELGEYTRGQQNMSFTKVNLKNLLGHFRELNSPYFAQENVEITMSVPDVVIEAEPQKLIRVLQNLVSNAIDAFDGSEGRIDITGEVVDRNRKVELRVSDNGSGVPESIRVNFFEPFVTYGKKNGTGLGTAIARSIIEAHNGTIDFETKTEEGTTFRILLPVKQGARKRAPFTRSVV